MKDLIADIEHEMSTMIKQQKYQLMEAGSLL